MGDTSFQGQGCGAGFPPALQSWRADEMLASEESFLNLLMSHV